MKVVLHNASLPRRASAVVDSIAILKYLVQSVQLQKRYNRHSQKIDAIIQSWVRSNTRVKYGVFLMLSGTYNMDRSRTIVSSCVLRYDYHALLSSSDTDYFN